MAYFPYILTIYLAAQFALVLLPNRIQHRNLYQRSLICMMVILASTGLRFLLPGPHSISESYVKIPGVTVTNKVMTLTDIYLTATWLVLALGVWWLIQSALPEEKQERRTARPLSSRPSSGHRNLAEQGDSETP